MKWWGVDEAVVSCYDYSILCGNQRYGYNPVFYLQFMGRVYTIVLKEPVYYHSSNEMDESIDEAVASCYGYSILCGVWRYGYNPASTGKS